MYSSLITSENGVYLLPIHKTEQQYLWSYTSQENPTIQLKFHNCKTNITCLPDSTGQMYEKCLLLSTPSPTQPEQDITSVAPTTNNYQNSFQDVTFYFSLMPQIVKL